MNLSQKDWINQLAEDSNAVVLDVRTEEVGQSRDA